MGSAADEEIGPKAGYHHGDLGRALVAMAARIIGEEGAEALTLREVGRRLGVSRTALYRHYDGKGALLDAVALEGFVRLRSALEAALAGAAPGREPVAVIGEAYIAFGVAHAAHYRTMFGPTVKDCAWGPALREAGRAAFGMLVAAVAEGQAGGRLRAGDPVPITQALWATVHGVVSLADNGNLSGPTDVPADPAEVGAEALALMLDGLARRPADGSP